MIDMNDFLEAWNRSADTYDAYADRFSQHEETSRFLVDVAGVGPGQTVVDLACGTGVTSGHILDKVEGSGTVVAVDFSEPMLEKARKNILNGNIRFVRARAEELSLAVSGSVDVVVCNSAFWHSSKTTAGSLKKSRQSCTPGVPSRSISTSNSTTSVPRRSRTGGGSWKSSYPNFRAAGIAPRGSSVKSFLP